MAEKNYDHRDVLDKLDVRPEHVVALDEQEGPLPASCWPTGGW